MEKELISVIIPVYKVEPYLRRCVESVRNQTYSKLEIILVDDGSPDACPQMCDKYADEDIRIKVIHKKNGGLSDARNEALEIVNGEWISFVDSDDYIHPRMYEELLSEIRKRKADIGIVDNRKVYDDSTTVYNETKRNIQLCSGKESVERIFSKEDYIKTVVAWGKIYSAKLFEQIRFPVGKHHEDEFTTYKVLYQSNCVLYLDKKYYYYYQRRDSIMGQGLKRYSLDSLEALKEMEQYFIEREEEDVVKQVVYRNMCVTKKYIKLIQKSDWADKNEVIIDMKRSFKEQYEKSTKNSYSLKRKIRLFCFRYLNINI